MCLKTFLYSLFSKEYMLSPQLLIVIAMHVGKGERTILGFWRKKNIFKNLL